MGDTYWLHLHVVKARINLVLREEPVIEEELISCILLMPDTTKGGVSEISAHPQLLLFLLLLEKLVMLYLLLHSCLICRLMLLLLL